ncbi:5477_t:CDS:2 [Acaulospora morrowiae]|uniref:5477_t:CDS:1 n=1 Tax=Acaulospora morrowiae TaxID=94023 RepID=A0A9N8YR23_9GLOM|nr:5477_t:CDS:2 [Acaulospora morrowiae]
MLPSGALVLNRMPYFDRLPKKLTEKSHRSHVKAEDAILTNVPSQLFQIWMREIHRELLARVALRVEEMITKCTVCAFLPTPLTVNHTFVTCTEVTRHRLSTRSMNPNLSRAFLKSHNHEWNVFWCHNRLTFGDTLIPKRESSQFKVCQRDPNHEHSNLKLPKCNTITDTGTQSGIYFLVELGISYIKPIMHQKCQLSFML